MKILSINPGKITASPNGWKYSIIIQQSDCKIEMWSKDQYPTSSAAKQAMREEVAHVVRGN